MGWFSHGIYGGDDTQTCHLNFLKWAKLGVSEDEAYEWLGLRKTVIPTEYRKKFIKNSKLILEKMKVPKYWTEYNCFDWHMLLALFADNDIKPPRIVKEKGIDATTYLMGDHARAFDSPSTRRRALKRLIERANKL